MARFGISFQSDKSIAEYRELATIVDRYDFETVSVYQDLFFQPPWPALLQFAERLSGPLVGAAVANPYLSHPVLVAGHLALLDELSRGRAYLGVGRGAFFDALSVRQPQPLVAIREMVEMVQRFVRGDREPYDGRVFRASRDAYLRFPIPNRALPVLLGGWGPRTLALGGEIADMVKIGGCANAESAPVFRACVQRGADRAGRNARAIKLIYGAVTVVDRNSRIAELVARRNVAMYVGVAGKLDPTYSIPEDEMSAIDRALSSGDEDAAAAAISPETLRRFCVHGAPPTIIRHMEELFDAGVDVFELGTPHGVNEGEAIQLLGEEVLPYFED